MTDEKRQPLEFEAKWAPTGDWPKRKKVEKPRSLKWFEKIVGKIDSESWQKEEEKLPLKTRLKNWPKSVLKALPMAALLLFAYLATQISCAYIFTEKTQEIWVLLDVRIVIFWLATNAAFMGWQIASYQPGKLVPSPKLLFQSIGNNWIYFIGIGLFFAYSDVFGATKSKTVVKDLVNTLFVMVMLFGVVDMKAYRDEPKMPQNEQ